MGVFIRRWGNSAAVRLPAAALAAAGIPVDDLVEVREEGGRIVIERKTLRPMKNLEQLIDGITPENLHEETDWGPAVGREFW